MQSEVTSHVVSLWFTWRAQQSSNVSERQQTLTGCGIDDDGIRNEALRQVGRKLRKVNWNTIPATPLTKRLASRQ